jgi:hypothetical protein
MEYADMNKFYDFVRTTLAESREQQALIGSPHQVEAIRAQAEKRAPVFAAPQQP